MIERQDNAIKMKNKSITTEEKKLQKERVLDSRWMAEKGYQYDQKYMECVDDIFLNPVFQLMDQFIQHGNTTCKEHCIQVSYMTYQICERYGWDYRSAARAALLHDLFLYDWHTHAKETGNHFHGYTHPRVAMNNAIKYFDIIEKEQNMILRHMWPLTAIPPRYKEGFVLLYADKYCGLAEVITNLKTWFLFTFGPWHAD